MRLFLFRRDGLRSTNEATHRRRALIPCVIVGLGFTATVLSPRVGVATTIHVPGDAPTIQAAIDSAEAGDDVLVAPGQYFEHDITLKGGVWVHTEEGPEATIVDAEGLGRGFYGSDLGEAATIEGFTIRNGVTTGYAGGAGVYQSSLAVRDCVITDCEADIGGGVYGRGTELEVSGCRISNCLATEGGGVMLHVLGNGTITGSEITGNVALYGAGGGIAAGGWVGTLTIAECVVSENIATNGPGGGIACLSPGLLISDCVVVENSSWGLWGGGGISIDSSHGDVVGCTLSDNTGDHLADGLDIDGSDIGVQKTIISFNEGMGVRCGYSQVTFHCNDVYGNAEGDDLCGTDLGGNLSLDPLFCDPENGDYTLDGCSPCLPGNHPHGVDCGLIGALGQGCGATPVEETSWGRVKSLFR